MSKPSRKNNRAAPRLLVLFAALLVFSICGQVDAGPKRAAARESAQAELLQLCEAHFASWDRDRDGTLSLRELDALVESPEVRGDEAAAVVVIRRHFAPKGDESGFSGMSKSELLTFAESREAALAFSKVRNHLKTINHSPFLPGDPNLASFHQGGVGDCYLLSAIGAMVNRNPQSVRSLIQPLPDGTYEVRFPGGRAVRVSPVTDAELVLGAREGSNRGIWLCILENAYASVREQNRQSQGLLSTNETDLVARDVLGGGRAGPVIELLTGHKAASAPIGRWTKESTVTAAGRLEPLLIRLAGERRLMAAATGKNPDQALPKHIPHGHVCGVLGYDAGRRTVIVFNPWGNDFVPEGTPGLRHGYATRNGIFEVPIADFVQIFSGFAYETADPPR